MSGWHRLKLWSWVPSPWDSSREAAELVKGPDVEEASERMPGGGEASTGVPKVEGASERVPGNEKVSESVPEGEEASERVPGDEEAAEGGPEDEGASERVL